MKITRPWHTVTLAGGAALLCASALAQSAQPAAPTQAPSSGLGSGRHPYTPKEQKALNNYAAMTLGSIKLSDAGDAAAKRGDWKQAQDDYQQAVAQWPHNGLALYGLGDLEQKDGDPADAVAHYRAAIYTHPDPPVLPTISEWNADRLMKYVLLLSQAGQETEALAVYHHAVSLLDYEDGRPRLRVLLPDFGPGALTYTPHLLQAMAHVGVAMSVDDDQAELTHLQQATSLAPDLPVTHFYLGRFMTVHHKPGARAELERARQSGDASIGAEADRFERTLP